MSESEEMYLVSIARLEETGLPAPIPLARLAEALAVQPVSANQMVRKLEEAGWIEYKPYKGVTLTTQGRECALQILRHRRLWEVFLVEHLKMSQEEASETACRLEHFFSTGAAERLADFLGHPTRSPQGLPIPAAQTDVFPVQEAPLAAVVLNTSAEIARIEADHAGRGFLLSEGICPGETVRVVAIGSGGALLLQTQDGRNVHVSAELASTVWVTQRRGDGKGAMGR